MQIASEAFPRFSGRFHADARLPKDRVEALYIEWARRCASGDMADVVLVAQDSHGSLQGFIGFKRREPISTIAKVPVFGSGFGACRPDAQGAYPAILRAAVNWALERDGIAEVQVPTDNWPVIKIQEAVGLHMRRCDYNFHLWLD